MKKWDLAIIALVILLSLAPLAFLSRGSADARVVISENGRILYDGALTDNTVFTTPSGNNTVEIANGVVRMASASCPDGLCLHGTASPVHPLVCLPNRITVKIVPHDREEKGVPFDAVTE